MRKIREILRLRYGLMLSHGKIAQSLSIAESTVRDCLRRAEAATVYWPQSDAMDDSSLEERLYQRGNRPACAKPVMPDLHRIHTELRKKSVTLQLLWQEYKEENPQGYQYSRFCYLYQQFKKTLNPTFRNVYKAGEKMLVDYAGQTVPIHCQKTGEVKDAQIFIAVLGASNYTYAEASYSQGLQDWVLSHVRSFEFFDGVPEIIVPDNLKSAVSKACRYEPDLNPTYYQMAKHYETSIIPARPYRPKDKAKAENAVLVVERWILAALRNHKFFSLNELNQAIRGLLEKLNNRPFKKMKGSRRELYETLDKPELKPLPDKRYEIVEYKLAKVNINYHVELGSHHYSVPYQYVQKKVEIRYSENTVEIVHNNRRIASHPRSRIAGAYTTLEEHMPSSHRKYAKWTPERMIRWAGEAGEATAKVAGSLLERKPHPEQAYKTILGLIRLGDKFGKGRLNAACIKALSLQSIKYHTIKSILEHGLDREEPKDEPVVEHGNIRGPSYYH